MGLQHKIQSVTGNNSVICLLHYKSVPCIEGARGNTRKERRENGKNISWIHLSGLRWSKRYNNIFVWSFLCQWRFTNTAQIDQFHLWWNWTFVALLPYFTQQKHLLLDKVKKQMLHHKTFSLLSCVFRKMQKIGI